MWRHIHSSNSEFRLKSLNGRERGVEEQQVRKNLLEKVDRIKKKNDEREAKF